MNEKQKAIMVRECSRVNDILGNRGHRVAIEFIEQGLRQYKAALFARGPKGGHVGYGSAYREELIVSILVYRAFLKRLQREKR